MQVAQVVHDLLELDQQADILFVRYDVDQVIYVVSQLPNNPVKVCLPMPTGINKKDYKPTGDSKA